MAATTRLHTRDAGDVGAYLAQPASTVRIGVVVVQEIFGVNAHIRDVADRFAQAGLLTLAPDMFAPAAAGVELDYDDAGFARGRELATAVGFERAVAIVDAAAHALREQGADAVGVVGFCWGGSVAYLANTRLALPAVSYYGARTVPFLHEPLRAPMLFHFGGKDASIPAHDIDQHRAAHPQATIHVYPDAGHAFNRDVDPRHYHAASAREAWQRTLQFLRGISP